MISIIIPTYNEKEFIYHTVKAVLNNCYDSKNIEIIISDGNSNDSTISSLKNLPVTIVKCPERGRAVQMNYGTDKANGNILFFLHADTIPPLHFDKYIVESTTGKFNAGCFLLAFDHNHWFLQAHSWLTKFNFNAFRFGDQGLFVARKIFLEAGKYSEAQIVFEDQEIIHRIRKLSPFRIIKKAAITSSRKYLQYGIFKTQFVFYRIYFFYKLGWSQQRLMCLYRKILH